MVQSAGSAPARLEIRVRPGDGSPVGIGRPLARPQARADSPIGFLSGLGRRVEASINITRVH